MFRCSYTIIRESITSCLLKLQLLKQSIKIHQCVVNPLNAELNPICHLLALLGGATIVVVSRLRVNTVVMWLHILGLYWCMCVALFSSRLYCQTVQFT